MAYEMLVGLNVKDDLLYAEYRAAMQPILKKYKGGFGYDFKVSETLKSEADHKINRVFTIYFGSEVERDRFFSDAEYVAVKNRFFETSVSGTTIIASYLR